MGESRAARWLQILRWEAEGPPIEREAEVLMEVERERAKERLKTFRECVSKSDAQIGGK